jgi:3-hydroxyanthranilate 3,4-dioxygenase
MAVQRPFNIKKWVEENRHLLKPPVGNQQVYKGNKDFIVMVVGGPNKRKDFHWNETEEFFYQLEGNIVVKIVEDGKVVDMHVNEGDIFLLPPRTPHSPRRPEGSVGLVLEVNRPQGVLDAFQWYCENCGNKLYEETLHVDDIVKELPPVMNRFWENTMHRTCEKCGAVMQPPVKKV